MNKFDYFRVLEKAWKIVWRNKFLWVLGLGVFTANVFSNIRWFGNDEKILNQGQDFASVLPATPAILFSGLLLLTVFIVLRFWSMVGIYQSVSYLEHDNKITLLEAFKEAKYFLRPVLSIWFVINILLLVVSFVLFFPVAILVSWKSYVLGTAVGIAAFLIFLPVFIIAAYVEKYGYFYVIFSKLNVPEAMESAYQLFAKKVVPSIVMSAALLIIWLLAAFGITILLVVVALFALIPGISLYALLGNGGIAIVALPALIFILSVILLTGAVFEAYRHTIWTLFFRKIAAAPISEKEKVKAEKVREEKIAEPQPEAQSKME